MNEKNDPTLLSSRAYFLIKDDIVNCSLGPGQFMAQINLAEKYNVGLTPVREALRQLANEGFVQPVPRLGYIVSPVTTRDVEEIFEMRLILEIASVRLAVTRGTEIDLRNLIEEANFTYVYKDRQSYSSFLVKNKEFHVRIALISKNSRLVQQITKIMDELTRVFHMGLDIRDSAEEIREDHIVLAEALLQRDTNLVERLVRSEILLSRERVMEALKSYAGLALTPEHILNLSFHKNT